MEVHEVKELMDQFDKSSLSTLELVFHDTTIKMTKPEVGFVQTVSTAVPVSQPTVVTPPAPPVKLNLTGYTAVTAHMVGVFYTSPTPNEPPMVRVGDRVRQGDVVGLIEAMKMMSEVKAPVSGIVKEICVQNEALLGFGDIIMQIGE